MASIKIVNFKGEAPRVSSELLAETAAQTAYNVKLYSGDLIPYRIPKVVDNLARVGAIQTIYPLKNPNKKPKILSTEPTPVHVTALLNVLPTKIVKKSVKIKIATPKPTLFINSEFI